MSNIVMHSKPFNVFHPSAPRINNGTIGVATINGLTIGTVLVEADYSFELSEPLMHDTPLFVFKGRPADEDQEAVIEFADLHGMAVILDGRAVTLITDQPQIATLFKLTFGGDA